MAGDSGDRHLLVLVATRKGAWLLQRADTHAVAVLHGSVPGAGPRRNPRRPAGGSGTPVSGYPVPRRRRARQDAAAHASVPERRGGVRSLPAPEGERRGVHRPGAQRWLRLGPCRQFSPMRSRLAAAPTATNPLRISATCGRAAGRCCARFER